MSRLRRIFLAPIALGVLIFAAGFGHLGMCADEGGAMAALLILTGVTAEVVLLLVSIARAGRRRWKHTRAEAPSH